MANITNCAVQIWATDMDDKVKINVPYYVLFNFLRGQSSTYIGNRFNQFINKEFGLADWRYSLNGSDECELFFDSSKQAVEWVIKYG